MLSLHLHVRDRRFHRKPAAVGAQALDIGRACTGRECTALRPKASTSWRCWAR
jgi:hypothetical protein